MRKITFTFFNKKTVTIFLIKKDNGSFSQLFVICYLNVITKKNAFFYKKK